MNLTDAIIKGDIEAVKLLLENFDDDINDIDQYGYTPIIECAIADQFECALMVLEKKPDLNKTDVTGRIALHWSVDNNNEQLTQLFLQHDADPNAFTRGGQPVLVYPILRKNNALKQMLYALGADLEFAKDFINTKLLGHRFQLKGDVDIVNAKQEFIELDYEGFFLEFTMEVLRDSLTRFIQNFAAREMREYFEPLKRIIKGFAAGSQLLLFQHHTFPRDQYQKQINELLNQDFLILPIAYEGHAITFVKYGNLWAKCDRGEHSLKNGSINIYNIHKPQALNSAFLQHLIYDKQSKETVHAGINELLGLEHLLQLPLSSQISGNCSWANVEASIPTAYFLLELENIEDFSTRSLSRLRKSAMKLYKHWRTWDQDRALNECIQSYNSSNSKARRASKASILAAILFQALEYGSEHDLTRAEQIIEILNKKEHEYILKSYIETYSARVLSKRGNNLLHLLDELGIAVQQAAYPLPQRPEE